MKNTFTEKEDCYEINLTKGKVCKIDKQDFDLVISIKWHSSFDGTNYYAACSKTKKHPADKMHRLILNPDKADKVDHKNGDTLDNRRENLRICSHQQNMRNQRVRRNNTSKFRGVYFNKSHKKWRAQIQDESGRRKYLGFFDSKELAAQAFSEAAKTIYKDFKGETCEK